MTSSGPNSFQRRNQGFVEQRAVLEAVRDVPGEMVVESLPPQRSREQDDLLLTGERR